MFGIDPVANRAYKRDQANRSAEIAARSALQEMQNRGQLAVEDARGRNAIDLEGTQSGNRIKEKGVDASNKTAELTHQQVLAILSKLNIPYSKENHARIDQALTDPTIQGALQAQTMENELMASPDYRQANKAGRIAEKLAQGFKNQQMGTTTTGPGSISVVPSGFSVPPSIGEQDQVMGGSTEQSVEETKQKFTDPETGQTSIFPGQPKVTTRMLPGRVRPRVNPALEAAMPANLGGTRAGNIQAMPPLMRTNDSMNPAIIEQIRRTMSQQGGY